MASMFGIIPFRLLSDKSLSDGDKIMFAIISAMCNHEGKVIEYEEEYAKIRGCDERTIRSQVSNLVKAGHLYRKRLANGNFELSIASEMYFAGGNVDIVVKATKTVIDYWNSVLEVELPYTTVIERLVRRRLRKFSPEQLLRSVQGRVAFVRANPWFDKDENRVHRNKLDAVLESDEALEKFLNHQIDDYKLVQPKESVKLVKFNSEDKSDKQVLN